MEALAALSLPDLAALLAQVNSDSLVDGLRGFLLPIVLLAVGVGAIAYMFTQRASGLIGFLAVGILVIAVLTTPDLLQNMGEWIGSLLSG